MDDSLTITLSRAEALVLFDLLFGFRDEAQLPIRNDAERVALWMIEACLEKALAEPFAAEEEYARALDEARRNVITKWGAPPRQ